MEKPSTLSWKKWEQPGDSHLINRIQWDSVEADALFSVFRDDWFGYGKHNQLFEQKLSEFTGIPHFLCTNSGSSALDVIMKTLWHAGKLKRGDKILHPVSTFPTSISSAIYLGAIPVFIETKKNTYVVDPEQVEQAIAAHPDIKGMILPLIVGNIPDMHRIKKALGDRFLVEDCCDTMGGMFDGKQAGSFGDFMAFSFYGSHHITGGGGGGAIGTQNPTLKDLAKSITYWGRDFDIGDAFLDRYNYKTLGTNSQLPALLAAFGLKQMERLPDFIAARETQFQEMFSLFENCGFFALPETHPLAQPSWFAFPLVVAQDAPFTREEFAAHLAGQGIEVRPIMCGNILKQKGFQNIEHIDLTGGAPVGNMIQDRGMFLPCWGMPENQKEHYYGVIKGFLEKHAR